MPTYTSNAKLAKPATAERNWGTALNLNADILDGLAPLGGLNVTPAEVPSASLNVAISAGAYRAISGQFAGFAGVPSFAIPANTSRFLWITDGGAPTIGTAWPASTVPHVRLAAVETDASRVTSIVDQRVTLSSIGPIAGGSSSGASILYGTASARPAAGTAQRLYLEADGNRYSEDDGAAWHAFGPVFPLVDPPLTGWTQVNFGGATTTGTQPGKVWIREGNAPGGTQVRALTRAAPATPHTITAAFLFGVSRGEYEAGLVWRETTSQKLHTLGYRADNHSLHGYQWDTPTGPLNGDALNPGADVDLASIRFLRIADDGTNLIHSISPNGFDFEPVGSVARTSYMTTGPNEVGFFLNVAGGGWSGRVGLISWQQG